MSLLDAARIDAKNISGNTVSGFSVPIFVTSPDGFEAQVSGTYTDISQVIDPGTGEFVSGRQASVSIALSEFENAGFDGLPRGIADTTIKPWVMQINHPCHSGGKFRVIQSDPDNTLMLITCILGVYFD